MVEVSKEILDDIVRRIVDALHPAGVYLFGSCASGTARSGSDVDLLVLVSDSAVPNAELERRAHLSLWGVPVPVDIIVCTPEQFDKWRRIPSNLFETIAEEGRLIYAA